MAVIFRKAVLLITILTFPLLFLSLQQPSPITTKPAQLGPLLQFLEQNPTNKYVFESMFLSRQVQGKQQLRILFETSEQLPIGTMSWGEITGQHGKVYTGWCFLHKLTQLKRKTKLTYLNISQQMKPLLSASTAQIGVPKARLKHKVDGSGVLIGIIDTGIQITHEAFVDKKDQTRIKAILDYSVGKNGTFFSQDDIQKHLVGSKKTHHKDSHGHGTHVAGIAAGGSRTNMLGVAPRASLFIAKLGRAPGTSIFYDADLLDAFYKIHTFAKAHSFSYVVNLSIGTHRYGHDGHSVLEQGLASYVGKGKRGQVIVASAGNSRQDAVHASGWLHGNSVELTFVIPETTKKSDATKGAIQISIWFSPHDQVSIALVGPTGTEHISFPNLAKEYKTLPTTDGFIYASIVEQRASSSSKVAHFLLGSTETKTLQPGNWKIRMTGTSSRFNAYLPTSTRPAPPPRFTSYVSPAYTVSVPATSPVVISVGATTSRLSLEDSIGGVLQSSETARLGFVTDFSCSGTNRLGQFKPDILAPGSIILSAKSVDAKVAANSFHSFGDYAPMQGTSMSAPHVTGGVALILQKNKDLDQIQIKNLLIRNTKKAMSGEVIPGPVWGFGEVDFNKVLDAMSPKHSSPIDFHQSFLGCNPCKIPANGRDHATLYLLLKSTSGTSLDAKKKIVWQTTAGTLQNPVRQENGIYRVELKAPTEPKVAIVKARTDGIDFKRTANITFYGHNEQAGCSCNTAPTNHKEKMPSLFLLFSFLFCLRFRFI